MKKPLEGGAPDQAVLGEMDGTQQETLPARRMDVGVGEIVGDIGAADLRMPRLKITYGVGQLAEKFNPGDIILGDDNLLVHKGEALNVVIVSAGVYWKEYLGNDQFNAGVKPRVYATEKEVLAAGGTTAWVNDAPPTFSKAMDLKLLVLKPDNLVCGLFGLTLGGKDYAPAVWTVDKTAYRIVGPVVLSTGSFALRKKGLLSGLFEIKTGTVKRKTNSVIAPAIRLVGSTSDEFIAEAKAALGLGQVGEPEALAPAPAAQE